MQKRTKRVNIDKNIEVLIVNNTNNRVIFNNARMQTPIDLEQRGDEEYVTVADLRTMINSGRSLFEGFTLLVTEILHDEYTLEDLFKFVGLEKAYAEYFSLRPNEKDKSVDIDDIENFILKSNAQRFSDIIGSATLGLRNKIITESIILFKKEKLSDYNKMNAIKVVTKNEDLFLDAEETR